MDALWQARALRARQFVDDCRRRERLYDLAASCFVTHDPKDIGGSKLEKPWPDNAYFRDIWGLFQEALRGEHDEIVIHKVKQSFQSWSTDGACAAAMLAIPGVKVYAQSRQKEVTEELADRVEYVLGHLRGPLEGVLRKDIDWKREGSAITILSFAGEPRESSFNTLAQGAAQWRFCGPTIAVLDEAAYGVEQMRTHAAARSACEGGGFLIRQSTGCFGTYFNSDVAGMLAAASIQTVMEETPDEVLVA